MVKTAATISDVFPVVSATGAAADADSLPTGTLYVDGVANAASVTVTNIAGTGLYSWSVTMPALTAGQTAAVVIALTVGGVASHGVVYRAQADTNWQSETHTRIGAAGAGLTALGDARLANLDAAVSSRSTVTTAQVNTEADTALADAGVTSARMAYLTGPVATAAKLLSYFQSALRKDVTVDTDIGGNYDDATDSQEAIRDRGDAAWGSSGGIDAEDVWTYATRTLTQGAASVTAAVTGSSVTVYRGTRWSITLTGLTDMTGQTGVWLGVKANGREDVDTASICLVKTTTGLIAFAGDAEITAGHAAIVVNSSTSITITVEADATQYATPGQYEYAVKALNASGKPFMVSSGGSFNIVSDIPMAIS